MIRLPQAIVGVMASTIASGAAGGVVGATIGRLAPSFVEWLHDHGVPNGAKAIDATEFGFGLGTVSGLFLGAGAGLFLVCVLAFRDAWLARAGLSVTESVREHAFD